MAGGKGGNRQGPFRALCACAHAQVQVHTCAPFKDIGSYYGFSFQTCLLYTEIFLHQYI